MTNLTTASAFSNDTDENKMGLIDLIRTRRSISLFQPQPLPDDLIESLLETAVYAPNHRLTEPWRFIYLSGEAVARYAAIRRDMALSGFQHLAETELQKAAEGTYRKFATVPAYLLIVISQNPDPEIAEEDYAACAALIQNFLLLAWEQGIGSCWKTFKNDARLRALFGLQPGEKAVGIIHLGYPAELPISHRHNARERLTYIR